MRKFLLLFVVLLFGLIGNIKAESCEVISGDTNTIGSEVACGSEHFYIIGSNQDEVKMMSKYNLYVGAIYNKINLDANKTYIQSECLGNSNNSCYSNSVYVFDGEQVSGYNEFMSKIKQKYNLDRLQSIDSYAMDSGNNAYYTTTPIERFTIDNKEYLKKSIKLYPYNKIEEDNEKYALQDESALGVTGEKGNANYPIYATINLFPSMYEPIEDYSENYENFLDGYTNFDFVGGSSILNILGDYYDNLVDMGYQVSKIDLINMKELSDLVKEISGKALPLTEWYDDSYGKDPNVEDEVEVYNLGDLKEYVSNDYRWLWNTTYWTRTFVGNNYDGPGVRDSGKVYFVSSSGDICYSWSGCGGIPRAGLRPVVTMSKDNIKVNYKFIEGMGQTFNLNKNSNMKFRLNMEYEEFVDNGKIFIDDKEVSKVCYKLSKGSTIITFVDDCCKEYSLGSHTLRATLNNGQYEAVTDFIISSDVDLISKVKQMVENPNTSDKSIIIIIVAFISLLILFGALRNKLFNRKYENI